MAPPAALLKIKGTQKPGPAFAACFGIFLEVKMDKINKALLLIQEGNLYFQLKGALEHEGFRTEDFIFRRHECGVVFMDRSYFEVLTASYLRDQGFQEKIFLVLWENELVDVLQQLPGIEEIIDDVIIFWEQAGVDKELESLSLHCGKLPFRQILEKHRIAPQETKKRLHLPRLGRVA